MAQRIDIIDISHWQGGVDLSAAQGSGIVGAIIKATEGTTNVDDCFASNRDDCWTLGLPYSTYHYLHSGNIAEQMEHYLATIVPVTGERVCIDFEEEGLSLEDLRAAVEILQRDKRNLQVTVYSGHLIKDLVGDTKDTLLATTSLWLAQYTAGEPSWPQGTWPTYSLWQYTDQGNVPGIDGNCDCNEFNGSRDNCIKWLSPVGSVAPQPEPEPEPGAKLVVVSILAPDGVTVEVMVNGTRVNA